MRLRSTRTTLLAFLAAVGTLAPGHHGNSRRLPEIGALSPAVPVSPADVEQLSPKRLPPSPRASRHARSVSGEAMPVGDLVGWQQLMHEDFRTRTLPRTWTAYKGAPGGNAHGWWQPSQVAVRNGCLVLGGSWINGTYATGGVMAWGSSQTYGKYAMRFRMPKADGVKYALLRWPSKGRWPSAGEIDFAEDGDGPRSGIAGTLHHGAGNSQIQRHVSADFSQWQTVGVEWTPGRLVYTLNGRPWARVDSAAVPHGPMHLVLQVEAGAGDQWSAAPDHRTPAQVAMEVDWAVSYRRA